MAYFTNFQGYLFFCSDIPFEEKQKLDNYLQILEDSGVGKIIEGIIERQSDKGGRPPYNPYRLFAVIVYAFSKNHCSLRHIEESLKYDIRFMYLMEQKVPSYSTISRFCNNVVVAYQQEIFSCIVKAIIKKYNIDISDAFVDGTKLEANANKYKFVWKPRKRHDKLNEGLKKIISKYFHLAAGKNEFISKEVASYLSQLEQKIKDAGIAVVNGLRGLRQEEIVRDFLSLKKMLLKTLEYEEIETICGNNRNSYYKTDKDATAMCLKSDYYSGLGSNMHAAYALQIIVAKGFILGFMVSQDRADSKTFIPLLDQYYVNYNTYPKRLCADSGYCSLDNYRYMQKTGIENYIKPLTWQKMICGEWVELYHFDENKNLICLNGKIASKISHGNTHSRERETTFYYINDCRRCKFKVYCMKSVKQINKQDRVFEVCYDLYVFRKQVIENLLSAKGIEMRINRSSQVEGAFGVIKQDMDYERVRRKGLENVGCECMLVCLGYNMRKLFNLIAGKGKIDYWIAPDNLEAEVPKTPNIEKIIKKLDKKKAATKH